MESKQKGKLFPSCKRKKRTKNQGLLAWEAKRGRTAVAIPPTATESDTPDPNCNTRAGQIGGPKTSQDLGEGRVMQQLDAQAMNDLDSDQMTSDHGECAGLYERGCQKVVKTEMEWDCEIDCGSIVSKLENNEHGPASTRLREGAVYFDGHTHSVSGTESLLEGDHWKVERLCRLCLVELTSYTPIYDFDDAHRFNVADAINDLLGMNLSPDDGYPTKICNTCLQELAHFRRFKVKCFEAKAKLKDMVTVEDKKYYDHLRLGGGTLFEAEEREVSGSRAPCEEVEGNPEHRDVSMAQAFHQSESAVGASQEDVSISSECVGIVGVEKQYMIFCQPVTVGDVRDADVESSVTASDSGQYNKLGEVKNSGSALDSSTGSLISENRGLQMKNKQCDDQQEYHVKGETLTS